MKVYFKCGAAKPYTDFYKHSKMADGHLGKCKECTKADVKKHRVENDSVREYDRARGNRQDKVYLREYRLRFPKKYKAHQSVNKAIRNGVLTKADNCVECASDFAVEAHHDDYNFPLTVRWLCGDGMGNVECLCLYQILPQPVRG